MRYKIGDLLIWVGYYPVNTQCGIIYKIKEEKSESETLYEVYRFDYGLTCYPEWLLEIATLDIAEYNKTYGQQK